MLYTDCECSVPCVVIAEITMLREAFCGLVLYPDFYSRLFCLKSSLQVAVLCVKLAMYGSYQFKLA